MLFGRERSIAASVEVSRVLLLVDLTTDAVEDLEEMNRETREMEQA
jgi:hypothetical protein